MKNKDDEVIQQLIEAQLKGAQPKDDLQENLEDIGLYELLFRELSIETDVADNLDIADKIIRYISRKQYQLESIKYAFVIFVVIAFFFLITSLSIMFVDPGFIATIVNIATIHIRIIFLIVVILTIIKALDKVLIKKEQSVSTQ